MNFSDIIMCFCEMGLLQMWEDLIRKAKDGGLDCIDTYIFWNVHEPAPGNVVFQISLSSS